MTIELKEVVPVVSAIISIIGAWIAIRNTNLNIRVARLKDLCDTLALFLEEVNPEKHHWDSFKKQQYVSPQHFILESKLLILLSNDSINDKNLIKVIKKFKDECTDELKYRNLVSNTIEIAQMIAHNERSLKLWK